jgi:hypothetical protein
MRQAFYAFCDEKLGPPAASGLELRDTTGMVFNPILPACEALPWVHA